jgi:putative acetyltransferase
MSEIIIREIEPRDNKAVANLIREVLVELGAPKVGTAYEDKSLDVLSEVYDKDKAAYFVTEVDGIIVGGAGISQLENTTDNICELQKMYFSSQARGKGLGTIMIKKCVETAKGLGYEQCYLETLPYMKSAVKLYKKTGFKTLSQPLGNTGHYSCTEWMIKEL